MVHCRGHLGDAAKMNRFDHRGRDNREQRKRRHNERVNQEQEEMRSKGEPIKFEHWELEGKKNNWLIIRVAFKTPIIPVNFKTDIRAVLSEIFNEHL